MKLFTERERFSRGPSGYASTPYEYLDRTGRLEGERLRCAIEDWFSRYPPEHQAEFAAALPTDFDARLFELYIHEILIRLGYRVEVHPVCATTGSSRPDFLAHHSEGDVYVEATLATGLSNRARAARKRLDVFYDTLNRTHTDFFLSLFVDGEPDSPPPGARFRREIERWLANLDADGVAEAVRLEGAPAYPRREFGWDGCTIDVRAIPKSREIRGDEGIRPVGMLSHPPQMLNTVEDLRSRVVSKGNQLPDLDAPLIVAVNACSDFPPDDEDVEHALFGDAHWYIDRRNPGEIQARQIPNGAWTSTSGPRYRRISGVLISPGLGAWSLGATTARIYENPWASKPCLGPIRTLPRVAAVDDILKRIEGTEPRDLLGLPNAWPWVDTDEASHDEEPT